jgi:death-on-curing protein
VREPAALESAVATPQATFGGEFLHTSIPAMAAAYLFHLCQELVDLVLGVACGVIKKPALIDMFESRCSPRP